MTASWSGRSGIRGESERMFRPDHVLLEGLELIELVLSGDPKDLGTQGFELEEKPSERTINRTIWLSENSFGDNHSQIFMGEPRRLDK